MHVIITLLITLLLSACSMQQQMHSVQVEVSKGIFVALPTPAQLQQELNISQLITAQWASQQQQKLLVQLQVDKQKVVLAGFSSWGARILSLDYSGQEINTFVMHGLAERLPKPEQVLFNLMLSLWPIQAWQQSFTDIGWTLIETEKQRLLIDAKGKVVIQIDYQESDYLQGLITFKHIPLNYIINIETNSEL